jgi:hypothetical protein
MSRSSVRTMLPSTPVNPGDAAVRSDATFGIANLDQPAGS